MREELSERFLNFASKIIELGKYLNQNIEGRHVYGQLFRAGTSAGANFEESHSAESLKDFIHKRAVVLKELRESKFWLKLTDKSKLIESNNETLIFLLSESEELIKIIAKSITTSRNKIQESKSGAPKT